MKRERTVSLLLGTLTAAAMSFGGAMCIATGFVTDWSWPIVLMFCLGFSLLAAFAAQFRWGSVGLLAVTALGVFLLRESWLPSLEGLLNWVTYHFNKAYGFPVIQWSEELPEDSATAALCLLSIPAALGAAVAVCRRKSAVWGLLPGLLSLGVCLVVTDTVPHSAALFLVITAALLLVLPQSVRRRSREAGLRLTALALIPCCLFVGCLFWAIPREGYDNPGQKLQDTLVNWFWSLPFMPDQPQGLGGISGPGPGISPVTGLTTSLTDVGPRTESFFPVMEVTAPRTEVLYLRGQAYEYYDGRNWIALDEELEDDGWPYLSISYVGPLQIKTASTHPIRYFPYYIDKSWFRNSMKQGAMQNEFYALTYDFQLMDARGGATLSAELRERCLALPDATAEALEALLRDEILADTPPNVTQRALAIAEYVSNVAPYDLNTSKMPAGETDFALWFLNRAETGYCVHYATATAALLRAAGIPARYVTGYAVTVQENVPTTVLAKEAHAWVEYFEEGTGWVRLDATPAEGQPVPPEETPPIVTDPTEPSTGTTGPTEPSTTPEETTRPNQETTRPDRPTVTDPTQGTTGTPEPQPPRAQWLLPVLLGIAAAAGAAGLAWGQYILRCRLRRRRLQKLPPNRRALALWRRAKFYGWLIKQRPPVELKALADKAVFSQHTLTAEELREYTRWLRQAEQHLRKKPFYWLKKLFWALDC